MLLIGLFSDWQAGLSRLICSSGRCRHPWDHCLKLLYHASQHHRICPIACHFTATDGLHHEPSERAGLQSDHQNGHQVPRSAHYEVQIDQQRDNVNSRYGPILLREELAQVDNGRVEKGKSDLQKDRAEAEV